MNSFFDHSKFEAMKLLSSCEAAGCDEHQFCAKIKVTTRTVFKLSSFAFSCLPRGFWATI